MGHLEGDCALEIVKQKQNESLNAAPLKSSLYVLRRDTDTKESRFISKIKQFYMAVKQDAPGSCSHAVSEKCYITTCKQLEECENRSNYKYWGEALLLRPPTTQLNSIISNSPLQFKLNVNKSVADCIDCRRNIPTIGRYQYTPFIA